MVGGPRTVRVVPQQRRPQPRFRQNK